MCLLKLSVLHVLHRLMEDGVVQLQEAEEDVEGLEKEAFSLSDVLILSVHQLFLYKLSAQQRTSILPFLPWHTAERITHLPPVISPYSLDEGDHWVGLCLKSVD